MLLLIESIFYVIIFFLCFFSGTLSIFYSIGICAILLSVFSCKYSKYRKLLFFAFCLYSFIGTVNYCSYLYFCGFTFAPYHDDNYYWKNIVAIANGESLGNRNATLYEYVIAYLIKPFGNLPIEHYHLLPFNWALGALVVVLSVKFAEKVLPDLSSKARWLSVFLLLLNSSFIDGTVHLYRDILMCLFFIIGLSCIYENHFKLGFLNAIVVGLIRGANAFVLFFYMVLQNISKSRLFTKKILCLSVVVIIMSFFVLNKAFHIEKYMRNLSEASSTADTFSERVERVKSEDGTGGVMALLRSDNIVLNAVALPIYMVSPFKVRELVIKEQYTLRDTVYPSVVRLRVETIWESVMIAFYAFMLPGFFMGLCYWAKEVDKRKFALFLVFIFMVASVTYISMQSRHKMMFIMLYPLVYNYYQNKASLLVKKKCHIASLVLAGLLLVYNIM